MIDRAKEMNVGEHSSEESRRAECDAASLCACCSLCLSAFRLIGRLLTAVFFFQEEAAIRDSSVTGVQTCALPISSKAYGVVVNPNKSEKVTFAEEDRVIV